MCSLEQGKSMIQASKERFMLGKKKKTRCVYEVGSNYAMILRKFMTLPIPSLCTPTTH